MWTNPRSRMWWPVCRLAGASCNMTLFSYRNYRRRRKKFHIIKHKSNLLRRALEIKEYIRIRNPCNRSRSRSSLKMRWAVVLTVWCLESSRLHANLTHQFFMMVLMEHKLSTVKNPLLMKTAASCSRRWKTCQPIQTIQKALIFPRSSPPPSPCLTINKSYRRRPTWPSTPAACSINLPTPKAPKRKPAWATLPTKRCNKTQTRQNQSELSSGICLRWRSSTNLRWRPLTIQKLPSLPNFAFKSLKQTQVFFAIKS